MAVLEDRCEKSRDDRNSGSPYYVSPLWELHCPYNEEATSILKELIKTEFKILEIREAPLEGFSGSTPALLFQNGKVIESYLLPDALEDLLKSSP